MSKLNINQSDFEWYNQQINKLLERETKEKRKEGKRRERNGLLQGLGIATLVISMFVDWQSITHSEYRRKHNYLNELRETYQTQVNENAGVNEMWERLGRLPYLGPLPIPIHLSEEEIETLIQSYEADLNEFSTKYSFN